MTHYPQPLLRLTGPPDTWRPHEVGDSGARVFYVPSLDAWLKCGPECVGSESRALRHLQGRALVPSVLYHGEGNGLYYLLTSSLAGRPLCDLSMVANPGELVLVLAWALRELHALDITECPLDQRLSVKLRTWSFETEERAWLELNAPDEDLVFTHGDACLPNFVCDDGRYTGCIDLGDAGIADRWQDLALSLWSLQYNLGTKFWGLPFLNAYGIEPDGPKITYYLRLNEMNCTDVV